MVSRLINVRLGPYQRQHINLVTSSDYFSLVRGSDYCGWSDWSWTSARYCSSVPFSSTVLHTYCCSRQLQTIEWTDDVPRLRRAQDDSHCKMTLLLQIFEKYLKDISKIWVFIGTIRTVNAICFLIYDNISGYFVIFSVLTLFMWTK